jgi:oligosaccharide repeat unit polymerase
VARRCGRLAAMKNSLPRSTGLSGRIGGAKVIRVKKASVRTRFRMSNMFSPITFALFSGSLAILAFALPEAVYFTLLSEPKLVGWQITAYVGISIVFFVVGYRLTPNVTVGAGVEEILRSKSSLTILGWLLSMLLVLLMLANAYSILLFASEYDLSTYMRLLVEGRFVTGGVFDTYSESIAGVSWIVLGAPPVLFLAFWLNWRSSRKVIPSTLLYLVLALSIVRPALRGDRASLLEVALPLVLLGLYFLYRTRKLTLSKAVLLGGAILAFGFSVFGIFQISRFGVADELGSFGLSQLFGYYIGGYNRFASQMMWDVLPSANGYYALSFVRLFPVFNEVFPLEDWIQSVTGFSPPSSYFVVWNSVGLNSYFTSMTAFGITYLDFGWLGTAFFLLYGILARVVYNSLKMEKVLGIMLYGPVVWTILEWRGKLEITYYNFTVQVIFALLLVGVTSVLVKLSRRRVVVKRDHHAGTRST